MATPKQNRSSLGTDFLKFENQPTFSFHFFSFKSESRRPVDCVGTIVATEENYVATQHSKSAMNDKKTLSQLGIFNSRQTQHEVEVNSITTKTVTVATEVEKNHKKLKLQHNKENKEEISIASKEDYVTTIKFAE